MNDKIRAPIVWFGIFMALMLFQTSYMRLGTITAFSTLAMTIFAAFIGRYTSLKSFYFPVESKCILIFFLLSSIVTMFSDYIPSYFERYTAQILLFLVLATLTLNYKEVEFLRTVFIIATVIYAAMTIYSCIQVGSARYIHSAILLFNTKIDPNFIGIPFVAASSLVLDNILNKKRKIINLVLYLVIVIAIVYTASKSNFICLAVSNILVLFNFIHKRNIKLGLRILGLMLFLVIVIYGIRFISIEYADQWARMSSFGENGDNGRYALWERAFSVFWNSPLFGNGLGHMVSSYGKATHNTYLQVLCETGIIGSLLFLSAIFIILKKLRNCNNVYFILFLCMLLQVAFLDALDNRCFWVVICWMNLLPNMKEVPNDERYKESYIQ